MKQIRVEKGKLNNQRDVQSLLKRLKIQFVKPSKLMVMRGEWHAESSISRVEEEPAKRLIQGRIFFFYNNLIKNLKGKCYL